MDPVKLFEKADQAFGSLVVQIKDDQWDSPTPDDDWTVRDLVKHGLEGVLWVPDVLAGRTIEEVGNTYDVVLGADDLRSEWTKASTKALSAVRDVGDLEKTVHLSYGDFPARTYLEHQLVDLTIHAWDLARAIGADEQLDEELVREVFKLFEPQAEEWRAAGILKPAILVGDDASTQTKLMALSGRQV